MSEEILVNGIDALTGAYLPTPDTDRELAQQVSFQQLSAFKKRLYLWLADPTRPRGPFRKPIEGVDPLRLDSAGWAVVFAPGAKGDIRDALQPLLKHRCSQTGGLYQEHLGFLRDQTMETFLADKKAPPGNPDPKRFPYYVLLVGDPEEIPFRFQFELDVQYAVGRLWLDGLVTPPYGLCLMIACSVAGMRVGDVLKDTCIMLLPMLGVLALIILFPQVVLVLPSLISPEFLR